MCSPHSCLIFCFSPIIPRHQGMARTPRLDAPDWCLSVYAHTIPRPTQKLSRSDRQKPWKAHPTHISRSGPLGSRLCFTETAVVAAFFAADGILLPVYCITPIYSQKRRATRKLHASRQTPAGPFGCNSFVYLHAPTHRSVQADATDFYTPATPSGVLSTRPPGDSSTTIPGGENKTHTIYNL